jgi:hypothetical protein
MKTLYLVWPYGEPPYFAHAMQHTLKFQGEEPVLDEEEERIGEPDNGNQL